MSFIFSEFLFIYSIEKIRKNKKSSEEGQAMDAIIDAYDQDQIREGIPEFEIGDTVRVSTRIIEGEKERIQVFQGTVIARKGRGLSETFSLHRVSYGEGMERVFYLNSPRIAKIEVMKKGDVCRAKLYYLRGKTGKKAKVKEKIGGAKKARKELFEAPRESNMNDIEMVTVSSAPQTVEIASQE